MFGLHRRPIERLLRLRLSGELFGLVVGAYQCSGGPSAAVPPYTQTAAVFHLFQFALSPMHSVCNNYLIPSRWYKYRTRLRVIGGLRPGITTDLISTLLPLAFQGRTAGSFDLLVLGLKLKHPENKMATME